ncbi:UNVERIFIED_CONTAM: hypothetical protein NCL1_57736 [Trichonephila clavipes]
MQYRKKRYGDVGQESSSSLNVPLYRCCLLYTSVGQAPDGAWRRRCAPARRATAIPVRCGRVAHALHRNGAGCEEPRRSLGRNSQDPAPARGADPGWRTGRRGDHRAGLFR